VLDARTSCPTKKHPKKKQGAREAGRVSGTPPQEEVLARCAFRKKKKGTMPPVQGG
jgi:hypothetical protein